MFVNTVDAVEPIAPRLRHINLMQQMFRDIFVGGSSGSGTAWRRSVE